MLLDANMEVLPLDTLNVGTHQPPRIPTPYSRYFTDILQRFGAVLPSTFESKHKGLRHTYRSNFRNVGYRRIDYIAVPLAWMQGVSSSFTLLDLDTNTAESRDHWPISVRLQAQAYRTPPPARFPRFNSRWLQQRQPEALASAIAEINTLPIPIPPESTLTVSS